MVDRLPSGLNASVANEETLARFLTSSRQFNTLGDVKGVAYMPNPRYQNTSVYRRGEKDLDDLWSIADEQIQGRTVHGVAFSQAADVRSVGLDVEAEEPPAYHANIVKWPFGGRDPKLDKAEQKELAAVMASQAELVRR